jgi:hypothetical protein
MDRLPETEEAGQRVAIIYNPGLQTAAITLHTAAAITN